MLLEAIALTLAAIHFATPLAYYTYLKRKLGKPWNLKTDPNYKPSVSIIMPTYNEARIIEKRLENLEAQDYPREKLEIIVIDASEDNTAEIVEEWAKKHTSVKLKLIKEPKRRGKARALNEALKHASGEIIIIADADAFWPANAVSEAIKWLSDPSVGAVSCLKNPRGESGIESGYRKYYNTLRLAESKTHSTPIFHGELAAFKKELLEKVGGFPEHIGADDSHTATKIALLGYRAITPDTLWCEELVPNGRSYHKWRIRRAQVLIQHFTEALKMAPRASKELRGIIIIESFLHLANPWVLLAATLLLIASATIFHSYLALASLIVGAALLVIKQYRVWIVQQLYLIAASLRNLVTKEVIWEKQPK